MNQNIPQNTPFSPFTLIEGPTLKCDPFAVLPLLSPPPPTKTKQNKT